MLRPDLREVSERTSRFTVEQQIGIINEVDAGSKIGEVSWRYGISEVTFYRLKSKLGGMSIPDAGRLKDLEDENWRLRQRVAGQALDLQAMKAVIAKKW